MFGKKKTSTVSYTSDAKRLLAAMDEIINGNYEEIDTSSFHNPIYGEKLNAVIYSLKHANNAAVMRMNETMAAVGDNSLIKQNFDQVHSQTESIRDMKNSSLNMEEAIHHISTSMGEIRDNTHEILTTFQNITQNMTESIQTVNESSDKIQVINQQMQNFNKSIDKIGEIISVVKKVAFQSNLLALNASIEAAKAGSAGSGFAVVANEMRQLSISTSKSAEDITSYVKQLSHDSGLLAVSMDETAASLNSGNAKVEASLSDMEQMSSQITAINARVDSIFDAIDTQTNAAASFSRQIENLSDSYDSLSENCLELGRHIFRIGRYIDKTRSDMVRKNSVITDLDWIRVFEVDHFVLVWRVYNNIVGFEHLQAKQVNNPAGCKLGKWLSAQTNQELIHSPEFQQLSTTHKAIHDFATRSWQAKEDGNDDSAMNYFQKAYQAFMTFDDAIKGVLNRMHSLGYSDLTEIVPF